MRWPQVRAAYPDQWLIIEALEVRTVDDRLVFDRIAVVEVCADGPSAMKRYGELDRKHPDRVLCFAHTAMIELDIEDRRWISWLFTAGAQSSPPT